MNEPLDPIVSDAYERHSKAFTAWQEAMRERSKLPEDQRGEAPPAPGWSDAHDAARAAASPAPAAPGGGSATPEPAPAAVAPETLPPANAD